MNFIEEYVLRRKIRRVILWGSEYCSDAVEIGNIKNSNFISLTLTFFCLPYSIVFTLLDIPLLNWVVLPTAFIYFLTIFLNRHGLINLSRILLIVSYSFSILFFSDFLGKDSNIHLMLFSAIAIPLTIYKVESFIEILFGAVAPILVYVVLELFNYNLLFDPHIDLFLQNIIGVSLFIVNGAIIFLVMYYFFYTSSNAHRELDCEMRKIVKEKEKWMKSEQYLLHIKSALDSASDAIGISDAKGKHVYQNKAFSKLFGYDLEELNGEQGRQLILDSSFDSRKFKKIMKSEKWAGEAIIVTKWGTKVPVFVKTNIASDDSGEDLGLIAIFNEKSQSVNNRR